ncbi:MAG: hypothetical protein H6710_17675 [Myxococcales bacterium]|nr:hypothetical protein [Myxococcales bacterium]
MPHPAPQTRAGVDALARNAECESCHPEVADEWRASLHAEAFTVREFQHAFRSEPLAFCRSCHAPEAGPAKEPALEAIGVACVTCHLPEGERVLAAARPVGAGGGAAPHPLARSERFASDEACAACHEFTFPDRRPVPEFMQTTVREHRRSAAAERPCADCHMPERPGGGRSHAFHASRDGAWMRSVVAIEASRPTAEEVEIRLELDAAAVGHALPTGDLFRQISVEARSTRRSLRPLTVRRVLARHWSAGGPGSIHREELADDRLGVGDNPRIVRLTLDPADAALAVRWRVRYERVESFVAGGEALVVGGVVLGEGLLEVPGDGVVEDAERGSTRPSYEGGR